MGHEVRDGQTIKRVRLRSLYDCETICRRTNTSEGSSTMRRACRCSLPGFDASTWGPSANPDAAHEAEQLAADVQAAARARGVPLDFELDRDGCPFGWAVSRFPGTVTAYTGATTGEGPRSMNTWLLALAIRGEVSDRMRDAVTRLEALEDGAYAAYRRVVNSA